MGLVVQSAMLVLITGLAFPAAVSAQDAAKNNTESGSLVAPVKAGSIQSGKPAAGSMPMAKPAAGSISAGRPSAGSMSSGKPSAGSLSSGIGGGSLSRPVGAKSNASVSVSDRRSQSADDGSSYTRKVRKPRVRSTDK